MRRSSKIIYTCLILLLSWMAARPYVPGVKDAFRDLYHAYQVIRHENTATVAQPSLPASPEEVVNRQREIVSPVPVGKPDASMEQERISRVSDSFIAEVRDRVAQDPAATMRWLQEQHSGGKRLRGMLEVVALWAADDAESALLWLESNAQGLTRIETLRSGVDLWAKRAPKAAADWIDGMADDGSKAAAVESLATQWGEQSPDATAKWIAGLPAGPIRQRAAEALAAVWVAGDPQAAAVWALGEAEFRGDEGLLRETVIAYSQQSPADAEQFLRSIGDAIDTENLIAGHVAARSALDPVATADWLASLPPSDALYQPGHARTLMQVWAESDSIAASTWLSEQEPGPSRDAAVSGFAESVQAYAPEAATVWAETINDPNLRQQHLGAGFRAWAARAPDEALEWIDTSGLSPAERELLLRQIEATPEE